ncbi:MAG: anhydro-N-acetylmuramic acid kinase [Phycisphaerales bacterium]|nr:anhydro-N-acetylmuramic acid kinase [Phycisphaerales bacterium]
MAQRDQASNRFIVGCMTGTSIDAIDAACVEIEGHGLAMTARPCGFASAPLGALVDELRALAAQHPMTARQVASLNRAFSLTHINVIRRAAAGKRPDLVAVHGQTVFHDPPVSWQLINATVIAAEIQAPVVSDLRAADLALDGQGAPITPLADWVLFRDQRESRAIVNLGGFSNFTYLPAGAAPQDVIGGDICLCNQLLDYIARKYLNRPFDDGGAAASAGAVSARVLQQMLGYLGSQSGARRSLGTRDECLDRIEDWGRAASSGDLARTACEAIAQTIAAALPRAQRVLLAGGGAKNAALTAAIRNCCGVTCESTERMGVATEAREAVEIAILGALCDDGVPIALPRITGARGAAVAGTWVRGFNRESG